MYRNGRSRFRARLAAAAAVLTASTLLAATPAAAAPYRPGRPQREPTVPGVTFTPPAVAVPPTGTPFRPPAPLWPTGASAEVDLTGTATGRTADGAVAVSGMPVTVSGVDARSPQRLRVDNLGRRAGLDGIVLRVAPTDATKSADATGSVDAAGRSGSARVSVDYRTFRWAYGGDWASRLTLQRLPECALSTPQAPACRGVPVTGVRNDVVTGQLSGLVDVASAGGVLLAVTAGSSGGGGDHKATSLAPSATWSAGGNSGDFSWTYPMRMPPAINGPKPSVSLQYSSASVDGRMASTNNQASWIGDGFDWQPGAIERRYNACAEDMGDGANNTVKTGDQCWETDNATLSLPGHAGELIKDAADPNLWHLRSDDGTRVERRTGGPNGDNDGEWWLVTTVDGTKYWFGGRSGADSTLTVPVYGNHSGEPCRQTAFADSWCRQGYRWLLDYVVDLNGNTMTYTYTRETNKYGRNNKPEDDTGYDRDGYLAKIEYGTRVDLAGPAPAQVIFSVADRCLAGCTVKDGAHWPDVPFDRECAAATCLPSQNSPTFWSTKRLSAVTTRVWNGTTHTDVESWTLTHTFPDSDSPTLWLSKLSHTGLVGTATPVPDTTFVGVVMPNRVDTDNDQFPALNRYRMKTINSETGGKLDLTYTDPDCVRGSRVPDKTALHNNTLRCYPVKWQPEGQTEPIDDFFHRYLIKDVVEADLSGSSSRVLTHYDYVGDPAWHYTDDDGFLKKEYKTWSVWRGYATVRTTKGDPGEQTREERRYFRGMHGDKLPTGTRSVVLPAIATGGVPAVADEDAFSGMTRETITYNGPGGAEVSATVTEPWQSAPTASRTINGVTVHARRTGQLAEHQRTTLDKNRPARTGTTVSEFDAYGMVVKREEHGDDAVAGDERCLLTDYVRNNSAWILDRVGRERTYAVDCAKVAAGGLTADDVISDDKTSYDGLAWNAAPTRGLPTRLETLSSYAGGVAAHQVEQRKTYDAHGRVYETWDVRGGRSTSSYTPPVGGPVTANTETNAMGWIKVTDVSPAWGSLTGSVDTNGRRLDYAYDGLGRLTAVWLPGRDRSSQSPNVRYEYLVRNNAPTVITTQRLNAAGGYITSYLLHDNLLRLRQTQEPDAAGGPGAVVTDTYYDSTGRAAKTHNTYLAVTAALQPVPPSTQLFLPSGNIPSLDVKVFDGAGRVTEEIHKVNGPPASPGGTETWRTSTRYGGDRVDTTPPQGGVVTSKVTDIDDAIVELRQYHQGVAAGGDSGFDRTRYEYDRKGKLVKLTDPLGGAWTYAYDLKGRQIKAVDPDKGTTTKSYNDAGDVLSTTDDNGDTLAYTYDEIGRKTTLRDGSATGPKRAEWFYDTLTNGAVVRGELVKTARYDAGGAYEKEYVNFTVDYKPTGMRITVPAGPTTGALAGVYNYVYTYNQDGSLATTRLPGGDDLGLETLTRGYNALGKPVTLGTSLGGTLVAAPDQDTPGTEYTSFGELAAVHLRHNGGPRADVVRTYDAVTRRLAQVWTTRATTPTTVADVRYSYDKIGNVTGISDVTAGDHQCFRHDHLQRLTEAWTTAGGDCAPDPTVPAGPAKYWSSFTYDEVGNRTKLVEHATATGDRTTRYTIEPGTHQLTGTTINGIADAAYGYDDVGNTVSRPAPAGGVQRLTWDAEGRVSSSQDSTGTTSYVYDVDGTRLLRKDPGGQTLYLPGQELRVTTGSTVRRCTRYYSHADQVVATRSAAGVTWLSNDLHGTAQVSVAAVGQAVSIRRQTPFGVLRATTGTWPAAMDKGFVGGTKDNTGLTHLGAREYDPVIGRFVSVDPVIDDKDPQQLHGYSYANNSPVTSSDPDGMWPKKLDDALKKVPGVSAAANVVKSGVSAAAKGVSNTAKFVYNNAGAISAGLGVAAMVCSIVPPLQVIAPALGAASALVGALDTFKSCADGAGLDCALGVVGMVPGLRVIKGAKAATKEAMAAEKAVKAAEDDMAAAWMKGMPKNTRQQRGIFDRRVSAAENSYAAAVADTLDWRKQLIPRTFMDGLDTFCFVENVIWEGAKGAHYIATGDRDRYYSTNRTKIAFQSPPSESKKPSAALPAQSGFANKPIST
ncbi:RHS repeat-associated core domain-containing protein [Catellatospora chokoriensis]|uniref:Teneurin-like YD-shell domain-containing protein n=2 Tax=Catellatospora chokoriensis TaxID=310353 RepID=A0A8J3K3T7_9ACTN|nr:hypothetical protein Cch02nite_58220 [Catellatospora chokoriensis]